MTKSVAWNLFKSCYHVAILVVACLLLRDAVRGPLPLFPPLVVRIVVGFFAGFLTIISCCDIVLCALKAYAAFIGDGDAD